VIEAQQLRPMSSKGKGKAAKKSKPKRMTVNLDVNADVPSVGRGSAKFGLNTRSAARAPTAISRSQRQMGPDITSSRRGRDLVVVVRHREFIGDVNGSEDFFLSQFQINPGLVGTFPWLASIAMNFESYHFRHLVFTYETQSPTTDPGTVMLAIDYDAADSAPTSKVEMMSLVGAVRAAVWNMVEQRSTPDDLRKMAPRLYVRNTPLASNLDIKTYDVGSFFIATMGTGLVTTGELYVEYEVELTTPTWEGQVSPATASWRRTWATGDPGPTPTGAFPLDGDGDVQGTLPVSLPDAQTVQINQVGTYIVTYNTVQSAGCVVTVGGTVWFDDVGCDCANLYPVTTNGATLLECSSVFLVDVLTAGATFKLTSPSSNTVVNCTSSAITISPFEVGIAMEPPIGPALGFLGRPRWVSRTKVFCPVCLLRARLCKCVSPTPISALKRESFHGSVEGQRLVMKRCVPAGDRQFGRSGGPAAVR
jgi:hypothetical protein